MSEISYISKEYGNGQYAQAYALFNVAFSSGFLVGPIWGGLLTEAVGWDAMVTSLTGLAVLSLPPVILWTGGPIDLKRILQMLVDKEISEQDIHARA